MIPLHTDRAARQSKGLEDPLSIITQGQRGGHNEGEVVNRVLIYLLGQKDKLGIAELLDRFHQAWLRTAAQWIEIGQRSGVIPSDVPAHKTAELFTLLNHLIALGGCCSLPVKACSPKTRHEALPLYAPKVEGRLAGITLGKFSETAGNGFVFIE